MATHASHCESRRRRLDVSLTPDGDDSGDEPPIWRAGVDTGRWRDQADRQDDQWADRVRALASPSTVRVRPGVRASCAL